MTAEGGLDVVVAPTEELDRGVVSEISGLLDRAFDDFSDDDWQHTLGGWHVVLSSDGAVVAHAAVVERTLEVGSRPFRAGYAEGVATEPRRQGQGLGTVAMRRLAEVIERSCELGALSTGEHHFYERLGWERWRGPSWVRDARRATRTPDEDDGIMVLRFGPSASIPLTDPITCEARPGDDW